MLGHQSQDTAFPILLERAGVRNDMRSYRLIQQSALAEFSRAALQTRDIHVALQRAAALGAKGLNAPFAMVMEFVADGKRQLVRAGYGWPSSVEQSSFVVDSTSPAGRAFQTGQAIITGRAPPDGRFEIPGLRVDRGIKTSISVRIDRGGRGGGYFGVLQVDSPPPRRFDEADAAFLTEFADIVGIAIERLHEETRLRDALDHQAMLTREMGHRVKNSLSSVVAMLRVQAFGTDSVEAKLALGEAGSRVAAIAQVHDHLSRASQIGFIDVDVFLIDFCKRLQRVAGARILNCDAHPMRLSADHAVPLGLLLNELVSNAVKHAYPGQDGPIDISARDIDGCLQLSVSDQGVGLPDGFDIDQPRTSLGFRMIKGMVQQLRGRLTLSANQPTGTRVLFELPILPRNEAVVPAALVTTERPVLEKAR
ncbi:MULTISPECIES: sensor histidine kinase [unclassified Bradyrhizobium]|uniref:sensor histidine kinase n=1 Tax=unclassified Bradyrhizobium TaxID=2631580 RepID=UPI0029160016|nr:MULTISPECIES: histidine kinase dimerization/phosphoacceptor domain -containing protein [unclassified Bradyrhizobium]